MTQITQIGSPGARGSGRGTGAAQRAVRINDRRSSDAVDGSAGHSSSTIAMSDPRFAWMSTAFSGVSRCALPSRCDWKWTPCSSTFRRLGKAEHLVAAAVGEDRPRPAAEAMQPAASRDQLVARTEIQVIRIAENHAGAGLFEVARSDGLHHPLGADRHERRASRCRHGGSSRRRAWRRRTCG